MIEYKGLKPVHNIEDIIRGRYTKIGRIIIEEFQKSKQTQAEVKLEYDKTKQLLSLYNAIKSIIRRSNPKLNLTVSIDRTKGKLYLMKEI